MQVEDVPIDTPPPAPETRAIPPVPNQPPVDTYEEERVEVPIEHHGAGIPEDPAPNQGGIYVAESGGDQAAATGKMSSFQTETACIGGILVASCVELAQAAENCQKTGVKCDEENGFAVAVGCISLLVCLIYCACYHFAPAMLNDIGKYLPIFLFFWWGIGTIVLTFDSPFIDTGNGYFACWGAVLLSIYYCQLSVERFKVLGSRISNAIAGSQQRKLLMLVMILSFVVAFAALVVWDDLNVDGGSNTDKQSDQETWAFTAGIVSGGIAAIYLLLEMFKPGMLGPLFLKYFSWFLIPWWMFGAGVATFDAPFPSTGNGYFCAWGAFLSSCYLAYCTTAAVSV